MPDNQTLAAQLATLAPNSDLSEVIKEISLVELGEAFKDCAPLKIRVNPPAIFNAMLQTDLSEETLARDKIVRAVSIFTDIKSEDLTQWADPLLYWVFHKARDVYWTYWGELRKNSKAQ